MSEETQGPGEATPEPEKERRPYPLLPRLHMESYQPSDQVLREFEEKCRAGLTPRK